MALINFGYSPENLRALLHRQRLTREDLAEMLDVTVRAVHRWCAPVESREHRDMPYETWRDLLWWATSPAREVTFTIPFGMAGEKDWKAAQRRLESTRQAREERRLPTESRRAQFLEARYDRAEQYEMALCFLNPPSGVCDGQFVLADDAAKTYTVRFLR